MKKTIVAFISFLILLYSCDRTPLYNDVQIITNTSDIIHTAVGLTFLDAKTGNILGNSGEIVRVSVTGQDADDVYDITGKQKETYAVSKGFLALGVYSDREPSLENPLKFNLVIQTVGFLKTSIPIQIYGRGRFNKEVPLVRFTDPPEGVTTKFIVDDLANGALVEDMEIITDEVGPAMTKATITAPAGMEMRDESGNLLEGPISTRVVYFSHEEQNALQAYPGGLVAEVNENGVEDIVAFYSAGFVAIEIKDQEGREAKTFSNGTLGVEIEVSPNTYNPETTSEVMDGDVIPIWSYEVETGIWQREMDVNITTNGLGELVSTAQLEHLSFWNWDWKGDACGNGIKIFICSDVDPVGSRVNLRLNVTRCEDGVLLNSRSFNTTVGDCIQFVNVPAATPVMISAFLCGDFLGEQKVMDMCNSQSDFCVNPVEPPTEVRLIVDGYCPDNDVLIKPTFAFWYKNLSNGDCSYWYPGWFVDGEASIRVSLGKMYRFVIYYNGNWIEHDAVIQVGSDIGCENIPFSSDMCDFFQ